MEHPTKSLEDNHSIRSNILRSLYCCCCCKRNESNQKNETVNRINENTLYDLNPLSMQNREFFSFSPLTLFRDSCSRVLMKTERVEFETSSYLQVGTHLTLPTCMYPSTCLTSPHLIKRSMEVSFLGILFATISQVSSIPSILQQWILMHLF